MMWKGVGSMGGSLFTYKLVSRWLEVRVVWSLDSATRVTLLLATIAYPAHASGLSPVTGKSPP